MVVSSGSRRRVCAQEIVLFYCLTLSGALLLSVCPFCHVPSLSENRAWLESHPRPHTVMHAQFYDTSGTPRTGAPPIPTSSNNPYWWDVRPPPPPPTYSCYRGWDSSHYDSVMGAFLQKPLHDDLHPTVTHHITACGFKMHCLDAVATSLLETVVKSN